MLLSLLYCKISASPNHCEPSYNLSLTTYNSHHTNIITRTHAEYETVNAGTGKELTIKELTELVASIVGYEGKILINLV